MTLMILAYRHGTAAAVAPMQYSQIPWAVFFGPVIFGEMPDMPTLLGASVIVPRGAIILWREDRSGTFKNQPVLGTGSRPETGSHPRVAPLMRQGVFTGQSPDA